MEQVEQTLGMRLVLQWSCVAVELRWDCHHHSCRFACSLQKITSSPSTASRWHPVAAFELIPIEDGCKRQKQMFFDAFCHPTKMNAAHSNTGGHALLVIIPLASVLVGFWWVLNVDQIHFDQKSDCVCDHRFEAHVQHQIASKLDSYLSDVELCEFRQVSTFMTLAALAAVAV